MQKGCLKPATLLKLTLLHGCFSRFLNCTNGTKSRNAPHIPFFKSWYYFFLKISLSQMCSWELSKCFIFKQFKDKYSLQTRYISGSNIFSWWCHFNYITTRSITPVLVWYMFPWHVYGGITCIKANQNWKRCWT